MNSLGSLKNKNILFLQGPMGTFFKRLDQNFRKKGALTYRIGFNMGDQFFSYRDNYTAFREESEKWPSFIDIFFKEKKIDILFIFGDCRYYQSIAAEIAKKYDIDVYVFEEGYLRPHYITMEKEGVNGFSKLSREPDFYLSLPVEIVCEPEHAHNSKTRMIIDSTLYYAFSNLCEFMYPNYEHHREFSATKEAFFGIRGAFRKFLYLFNERKCLTYLTGALSKRCYFVPLQTYNDFQILQHSEYQSIEKFIIEVLESFAKDAPIDTYLLFKHHPVDRGRKNYKSFIMEQSDILNIKTRVLVLHDVFLPSILHHARATITINSTVGLTSVAYGIPTITLGDAIYDMEGLTNRGKTLETFWSDHSAPNPELYIKYKQFLVQNTQINGSFYGRMPEELR